MLQNQLYCKYYLEFIKKGIHQIPQILKRQRYSNANVQNDKKRTLQPRKKAT